MSYALQTVLEYGLEGTIRLLNRGFADYIVKIAFDVPGLLEMFRRDSVEFRASAVVLAGDEPAGVALIARRGWSSRLAAMAVLPAARRQGAGAWCVNTLLAAA